MSGAPTVQPSFDSSWPEGARQLLLRAIDRHGGWRLWTRLASINLGLVSLSGLLPRVKGYGRSFDLPRHATVYPKQVKTVWSEQPGGEPVAIFELGGVGLRDPKKGVPLDSPHHRRTLRGLRKLRRWRPVDAFYFFGYAHASYAAVPFTLPQLRYLRAVRGRWRGEPLHGVRVEFPAGSDVHSRRQNYLFDRDGLLRRNDYVADVVGPFARGAHGWDDYVSVGGLAIPARRTVVPRLGTLALGGPIVLSATFDGFAVREASYD